MDRPEPLHLPVLVVFKPPLRERQTIHGAQGVWYFEDGTIHYHRDLTFR